MDSTSEDYLGGFKDGKKDAAASIAALERVLMHSGFSECDIPECNCGSWHQTGGFYARFMEIDDAITGTGISTNGKTLLMVVGEIISALKDVKDNVVNEGWCPICDEHECREGNCILADIEVSDD